MPGPSDVSYALEQIREDMLATFSEDANVTQVVVIVHTTDEGSYEGYAEEDIEGDLERTEVDTEECFERFKDCTVEGLLHTHQHALEAEGAI